MNSNPKRAGAVAVLGVAVAALLPRMREEFDTRGAMSAQTATVMWCCYGAAGGLYLDALRRGQPISGPPGLVARVLAAGGLAMTAAGMAAFDSAAQVTGTSSESLAVGGVYRISRNPQYVGYITTATAGAVARRSPLAGAITVAYAGLCSWWVRIEERALTRRFGAEYTQFQAATPRWIGVSRLR